MLSLLLGVRNRKDNLDPQGIFTCVGEGTHKLHLPVNWRSPVGFKDTKRAKSCIKTLKIKYVFYKGRRKEWRSHREMKRCL